MAECDRGGIAAVFAANAHFELWPRLATAFDADAHQFPHALAVDGHEGIARKDAARQVSAEKARGVVAADAVGGLRQIVGAEGKELRALRDFAGAQRRTWKLDHGADLILDAPPALSRDRLC